MIVTTNGIILRTMKHGESSRIVTAYTRGFGKVSLMAKGARAMKSKFGSSLETFTESELTFYKKRSEGQGEGALYLVSKAEVLHPHRTLSTDLARIETASEIAELLLRTMHDEEQNETLYELTLQALGLLSSKSLTDPKSVLIYFFLHFADILGFGLRLPASEIPRAAHHAYFHLNNGAVEYVVASIESEAKPIVPPGTILLLTASLDALLFLSQASTSDVEDYELPSNASDQLHGLFAGFFQHHVSGLTRTYLRSPRVFRDMKE